MTRRRLERVQAQRYAWAAADGRQIRFHHLAGIEHIAKSPQPEDFGRRVETILPAAVWRDLEQQKPLPPEQDAALRELVASISEPEPRTAVLAALAQRDPSLAYRVAHHFWARDLAKTNWNDRWASVAALGKEGEALFVPAQQGEVIVVLCGGQVEVHGAGDSSLTVEPLATLGLRGAGLARVRLREHRSCEIDPQTVRPHSGRPAGHCARHG